MTLTVHAAFAAPMGEFHLPKCDSLNAELAALVLGLESQGAIHRNENPVVQQPQGLYESKFEFFARPEPCVRVLREHCWKALSLFIKDVNPTSEAGLGSLRIASQTWFHVTRDSGYFGYHNHPMASWSGVYCVSTGNPDPEIENNGCLVFPHPLPAANAFMDASNSTLRWPFSNGNLVLSLKPGQLVLFPSWLGHMVTPFRGDGERITVAFNAWFSQA